LRKKHAHKPKRERQRLKGFTKISRNARAENISQRGKKEVEGAGEF